MSRITFTSPSGEAELCGRERAHAGCLINDLTVACFGSLWEWSGRVHAIRRILAPDHYLANTEAGKLESSRAALAMDTSMFIVNGTPERSFPICLNTAMAIGGSPLKLLARLHAQCEIHGWIDGPNRAWVADIIEEGRRNGILRGPDALRDWGLWESVATFLRQSDSEPVVTSYSGTDSFPNQRLAGWDAGWGEADDGEGWYALSSAEQWERSMAGLRAADGQLEWEPTGWDSYRFGSGLTAFDLIQLAHAGEEEAQ